MKLRPGLSSLLVCGLLTCLPTGTAVARVLSDAEVSQLDLAELLEVKVYNTSQYVSHVSSNASAASVVTADEIRQFGYRNLGDILRRLPGLYVTYDRSYSYLGVRGQGAVGDWNSRVLILVDGYRVNENVYDGAYIGNDFIVDVGLIDRVEYVAGPAAAMLYGSNAFFGVVHVITRRGAQLDGAEAQVTTASAGGRHTRLSYGKQQDNGLDWVVSASRLRNAGRDLNVPEFGGTAVGMDRELADRLFARLALDRWSLELAQVQRTKGDPYASYGQVFNDRRSTNRDEQAFVDLRYNQPLGAESAFSARTYYGRYDYQGDFVYGSANDDPWVRPVSRDVTRGRWWGADAKYVSGPLQGHKLLLGADLQHDLHRDQASGYLGEPLTLDDHRQGRRWGLYVNDEVDLGPQLQLDVGARYDRPVTGAAELHPRLGLVHRWDGDTLLKALYGSAFRSPNVYEQYYAVDAAFRPNPDLKPERIKSLEWVLEHRVSMQSQVLATLFRNQVRGQIDYASQAGADGLWGTEDDHRMLVNARDVRTTGLELRYDLQLGAAGHLGMNWTWQRSRDDAGLEPNNAPRHLAKLQWQQALGNSGWRTGLELQTIGSRTTYTGVRVPGAALANLTLLAPTLARQVDLSFTVYNLFDRAVADPAALLIHAPLDRLPQDGRSWSVQATFRF